MRIVSIPGWRQMPGIRLCLALCFQTPASHPGQDVTGLMELLDELLVPAEAPDGAAAGVVRGTVGLLASASTRTRLLDLLVVSCVTILWEAETADRDPGGLPIRLAAGPEAPDGASGPTATVG